ncbi:MAG: hypothetical protein LBH43_20475 [Treponema sp.]|jgi:hypothetical protein|nr:hypothetical protein [Treponema sp.]
MKKLIAFFAVFALVMLPAFAQIRLNKSMSAGSTLAGNTVTGGKSGDRFTEGEWGAGFSIAGSNVSNTFGFSASFDYDHNSEDTQTGMDFVRVMAWWQPMPEIRFALGSIADAPLGWLKADFTAWSLDATDKPHINQYAFFWYNGYAGGVIGAGHGFYMGTSMENTGWGAPAKIAGAISFYPLSWFGIYSPSKLSVHFFFPDILGKTAFTQGGDSDVVDYSFKTAYLDRMEAQITYNFYGKGTAALTFRNSMRYRDFYGAPNLDTYKFYEESKGIYAQWNMNLPADLSMEAGVQYTINPTDGEHKGKKWPINAGLGIRMGNPWNDDAFVLTNRFGVSIPMEDYQNFLLGWDVCFNFKLGAGFRLYLPMGLSFILPANTYTPAAGSPGLDDDKLVAWHFSPFIRKNLGGPDFYLCLRWYNGSGDPGWPPLGGSFPHNGQNGGGITEANKNTVQWRIPVYLKWNFG